MQEGVKRHVQNLFCIKNKFKQRTTRELFTVHRSSNCFGLSSLGVTKLIIAHFIFIHRMEKESKFSVAFLVSGNLSFESESY